MATSSVIVDLSADTTRELGGSRHLRRFWRVDAHPARWLVDVPDGRPALSSPDTAREAEVTARRLAVAIGARLIYLHDAHHRVRSAPVRPM